MNLSITNECNRRCEYCFQKSWYLANKKEDIKEMSLEDISRIIDMLGDEKTALFVIISDTDDTFNFIVSIMYTQLFNLLCDRADDVFDRRNRTELIEEIDSVLLHLDDKDMEELAKQVIDKLQNMTDEEFAEVVLEAAE